MCTNCSVLVQKYRAHFLCACFAHQFMTFSAFFQILALLCMMCAAPAFNSTQHWFLLVVVCAFLGTIFFSLYHLCLDTYLKNVNVGWLPSVSISIIFAILFFLVWCLILVISGQTLKIRNPYHSDF